MGSWIILTFATYLLIMTYSNSVFGAESAYNGKREDIARVRHLSLSCKNITGLIANHVRSIQFLEYELRRHGDTNCEKKQCFIQPKSGLKSLQLRYDKYYYDRDIFFPVDTWTDKTLKIELDASSLIISPNRTGFMYELPRKLVSDYGSFKITCTDRPLIVTDKDLTSQAPTLSTSLAPGKFTTVHIVIVVIVILLTSLIFAGIVITICVCRQKKSARNKKDYSRSKDNTYASSKVPMITTSNNGTSLSGKTSPQNPDAVALYIDPEKGCTTEAPDHYDNVNNRGSTFLTEPNEYSYTYMDTTAGKLKSVGPKDAPKKALIPPKKPLKPKTKWQDGDVDFRPCSEVHYEDVQTPKAEENKKYLNVM